MHASPQNNENAIKQALDTLHSARWHETYNMVQETRCAHIRALSTPRAATLPSGRKRTNACVPSSPTLLHTTTGGGRESISRFSSQSCCRHRPRTRQRIQLSSSCALRLAARLAPRRCLLLGSTPGSSRTQLARWAFDTPRHGRFLPLLIQHP